MVSDRWTIKELLNVTSDYLTKKEIESPRLTAEILLAYLLNRTRIKLYLNFDQPLREGEVSGYRNLIRRRVDGEPLQYITGTQEFWSLDFIVGPQVLVPRPESELLVEQTISLFKDQTPPEAGRPRILDLGTGSGVLAVSIARELEDATLWASDISEEALVLGRLNAKNHGVAERIDFRVGDLWEPFMGEDLAFDGIVSNPPYVATEDFDGLPPEVRDHEPRVALDGGERGMLYIEKIIRIGPDFMNPGGWLLLEMAPDQTAKALSLVDETGRYGSKRRVKDDSHRYRVVVAQKKQ